MYFYAIERWRIYTVTGFKESRFMPNKGRPEMKKTPIVPAIITGFISLLLGFGGYFASSMYAKYGRKAIVAPAISLQKEAPLASLSIASATKKNTAPTEPPIAQHSARIGKPTSASAFSAKAQPSQTKALSGMVWIPGGRFVMGSPEGVGNTNEHPQHAVIVNGFYMDTTEVTQAEYTRVMGVNPSRFKENAACPVENVTWNDAMTYCRKVGKRLPTEAEWEYACRAGSTTLNYWGGDRNEKHAWYRENSEQINHPMAVGRKKPNKFGLYDMIGNVWEWCSDWFDSTYYEISPLQNPQGPDSGMHRVFRGGSWLNNVATLRSAIRDGAVPEDQSGLFGFRCVSTP
jgi:formylglycine-generating enzyme required for sulfatase activity